MRLDQLLVDLKHAPTRSKARDLIIRGFVRANGHICDKPGRDFPPNVTLDLLDGAPSHVSRGAEKLIAVLDHFDLDPRDRVALDVGASTGGFTEVLLQRGARKVYAVDVGVQQMHQKLRSDQRVVCLEKQDARALSRCVVPEPIDVVVVDVSFISLTKAIGTALTLMADQAWLAALIKPQFEVGRDRVGRGGIVRDEAARDAAVRDIELWLNRQAGWSVLGVIPSPILGGSGNAEFLLAAVRSP